MTKPKSTDVSTTTESSTESDAQASNEIEAKEQDNSPEKPIGMIPYKFAGKVDAWYCPDCCASTTDPEAARNHVCLVVKHVKPETEGDES